MSHLGDEGPEGAKVGIGEGAFFDVVFVADRNGFLEEALGFGQIVHLTGVTRKIVGYGRFFGEGFEGGLKGFPGGAESAAGDASQRVGVMEPGVRTGWRAVNEFAGDHKGAFPVLFGGVDLPAEFEDVRMVPMRAINLTEFAKRFFGVAEFEPPLRSDCEV